MTRALLTGLALVALAATVAASTADAATRTLHVTEAGDSRFPERKFILTLPRDMRLDERSVIVRENGARVPALSVVPAARADDTEFGVVLVIDTSNSMRGRAIADAFAAARVFAGQRNANQQVAIVLFNDKPSVLLPFTNDGDEIDAALAQPPPLAQGTHVYDGVDTALSLLREARLSSGAIVVVSDGADTGSRVSSEHVQREARTQRVRIFSVGIRASGEFQAQPLKQLATKSSGQYTAARSSADLVQIYSALGDRLAREYVLAYRSSAGPDTEVNVWIKVRGVRGTALSGYATAALPRSAEQPHHRSVWAAFWRSPASMLLVALLVGALFAFALVGTFRPRPHTLRRRMAKFVSMRMPEGDAKQGLRLTDRMFDGAEKSLEATKWWARFKEDLELAQIRMAPIQLLACTVAATLVVMWLAWLVLGSVIFALIGLVVPLGVRAFVKRKVERLRGQFAEQLPDNLQVLSSALRAGHSLVGALSVVVDDAAEPSRSEFRRVVADEQLGVPLEDAFSVVVRRMANNDLEQVALVAALQRQAGGSMAEVLESVADTVRGRFELRRMVKALTAQGRMSRWVISLLPVGLLAAISVINPSYVAPLFSEPMGRVLLVVAAVMIIAGSLVIKRIVEIKV